MKITAVISLLLLGVSVSLFAQNTDTIPATIEKSLVNKRRLAIVVAGESVFAATAFFTFEQLWHTHSGRSDFYFHNDNKHWLQVDKLGHLWTSYKIAKYSFGFLKWSGLEYDKSVIYSSALSLVLMTGIEIRDGFSKNYGASPGDLLANVSGTVLFAGQQLLWNDQKVNVKVSFYNKAYSKYRPELLGHNYVEHLFKDYNEQVYWLSSSVGQYLKGSHFPKWICIALGYGAEGMIGEKDNPVSDANGLLYPEFERYRKFYLSLDVDLTKIKTKNKFLKGLLTTFAFIKFPAPTLEYNVPYGFKFHPFFF